MSGLRKGSKRNFPSITPPSKSHRLGLIYLAVVTSPFGKEEDGESTPATAAGQDRAGETHFSPPVTGVLTWEICNCREGGRWERDRYFKHTWQDCSPQKVHPHAYSGNFPTRSMGPKMHIMLEPYHPALCCQLLGPAPYHFQESRALGIGSMLRSRPVSE